MLKIEVPWPEEGSHDGKSPAVEKKIFTVPTLELLTPKDNTHSSTLELGPVQPTSLWTPKHTTVAAAPSFGLCPFDNAVAMLDSHGLLPRQHAGGAYLGRPVYSNINSTVPPPPAPANGD
jgi:hypothetical protein